jgi:hypothetical protein
MGNKKIQLGELSLDLAHRKAGFQISGLTSGAVQPVQQRN